MQFSEMIEWIIRTTKRPDKREDIKDAINGAISFFSLGASFRQDFVETSIAISSTSFAQSISVASNFTRLRRIDYIKRPGQKGYINGVDPKQVFDKNGCEQLDKWYRAGDNIVFKMKTLAATLDVGYFQYPQRLVLDNSTHWMLDTTPDMVHRKAVAQIFDDIGEAQDSARYERRSMELFEIAKGDFEIAYTAKAQ
jgi:hypothetical protein